MIRKEMTAALDSVGTASAVFCISSPSRDRDKDFVTLTLESFKSWRKANAPWLHGHDTSKIGVGTSVDEQGRLHVWEQRGKWFARCFFDLQDPDSARVYRALKTRRLGAASVSFVPHDSRPLADGGADHRDNEITEISIVPIPSQAEATLVEVKRLKSPPPTEAEVADVLAKACMRIMREKDFDGDAAPPDPTLLSVLQSENAFWSVRNNRTGELVRIAGSSQWSSREAALAAVASVAGGAKVEAVSQKSALTQACAESDHQQPGARTGNVVEKPPCVCRECWRSKACPCSKSCPCAKRKAMGESSGTAGGLTVRPGIAKPNGRPRKRKQFDARVTLRSLIVKNHRTYQNLFKRLDGIPDFRLRSAMVGHSCMLKSSMFALGHELKQLGIRRKQAADLAAWDPMRQEISDRYDDADDDADLENLLDGYRLGIPRLVESLGSEHEREADDPDPQENLFGATGSGGAPGPGRLNHEQSYAASGGSPGPTKAKEYRMQEPKTIIASLAAHAKAEADFLDKVLNDDVPADAPHRAVLEQYSSMHVKRRRVHIAELFAENFPGEDLNDAIAKAMDPGDGTYLNDPGDLKKDGETGEDLLIDQGRLPADDEDDEDEIDPAVREEWRGLKRMFQATTGRRL